MNIRNFLLALTLVFAVFKLQAQPERQFDITEKGEVAEMYSVGKIVLANWSYDDFWYAGKIENTSHGKYFVRFYVNEGEWLTTENLTVLYLVAGDKVFCKSVNSLVYKLAEIGKIEGEKVFVKYVENGVTEWNDISNIRIKE
jgi:hypothetical protein